MRKLLALVALCALLMAGCGSKFNEQQFNKEYPCRAVPAEPFRCKQQKEAEALHQAAVEIQEQQSTTGR